MDINAEFVRDARKRDLVDLLGLLDDVLLEATGEKTVAAVGSRGRVSIGHLVKKPDCLHLLLFLCIT